MARPTETGLIHGNGTQIISSGHGTELVHGTGTQFVGDGGSAGISRNNTVEQWGGHKIEKQSF